MFEFLGMFGSFGIPSGVREGRHSSRRCEPLTESSESLVSCILQIDRLPGITVEAGRVP